jgi:micrococcal nuclease
MGRRLAVVLVVVVLLAGCSQSLSPTAPASPDSQVLGADYRVTVTGVIDGDTVRIRFANGTTDTVRLLGVDTPETRGENDPAEFEGVPETAAGRECLRSVGEDATRFATRTLLGEEVILPAIITWRFSTPRGVEIFHEVIAGSMSLRIDPQSDGRGYYDRLLAYVVVDDRNFNYRLLTRGYARVYDSEFGESERFDAAEARAQDNGSRVWACRTPGATDGGETATATATGDSALVVASIHADAAGRDGENLNDEYVVLRNRGDTTLDLSGWTVSDDVAHTYRFPDGASLAAGEPVTIHTGTWTDTASDRYWGRSSPVWNNDGDTVTVRAVNGTVVAQGPY